MNKVQARHAEALARKIEVHLDSMSVESVVSTGND
jgi:hypothetical protein